MYVVVWRVAKSWGGCGCMGCGQILWWVGVVVWGVAKSGGWVWLHGEWPNLGVGGCGCMGSGQIWGWVGVVVWLDLNTEYGWLTDVL